MTTSDERRAAGREIQGQLWPAILKGPTRAVPGGQAGAGLLRPRAAERVRRHLDAPGAPGARPLDDHGGLLAALGQPEELRSHLAGASNVGISREEIVEILMHVSIYAGVPAAGSGAAGGGRRARHRLRAPVAPAAALRRPEIVADTSLDAFQRRATSACCSATATSSLQSAPPRPPDRLVEHALHGGRHRRGRAERARPTPR